MNTLRAKMTALMMAAIIVSVSAIGGSSIAAIKREGDRNSAETMRLICDNSRQTVDSYLNSIEQSVEMVSRFAGDELSSIELVEGGVIGADGSGKGLSDRVWDTEQQRALDAYLEAYSNKVETLFRSVANHTNGVIAFYYRINPELSEASEGFLYSRIDNSAFARVELTDIGAYDPDDVEHVGWYYIPLERGRPSWIEPYDNENLGIEMFSYVAPLYKAGTFIGVIGMDISYEMLVAQLQNIRILETGYVYLAEEDGNILYHPWLEQGIDLAEYDPRLKDDIELLGKEDSNAAPLRYELDGQQKQMFFSTLSSGWKLVAAAPVSEINAAWLRLINIVAFVSLVILSIFTLLTVLLLKRVTEPLQRLTAASKDIAAGSYDVRLDYTGRDEVGILTAAFQQLVDHLKVYINDLNSKAYQDAMTGVRNKAAYTITARKLDDAIRMAGEDAKPEFAVVMLDCNDLKKINDTYGHEQGDIYLRAACAMICDVFPHSPVFRMGGDEFVVLLRDESYARREELLREFDARAAAINAVAAEPWELISIAKGAADYEPMTDENVGDVFRRADERMYEDKKMLKAARRS